MHRFWSTSSAPSGPSRCADPFRYRPALL